MELKLKPLNLPSDLARPIVISGPCSAETEEQVMKTALQLATKGCHMLCQAGDGHAHCYGSGYARAR